MSAQSAAAQAAFSEKCDISSIIAARTKWLGSGSPVYSSKYCVLKLMVLKSTSVSPAPTFCIWSCQWTQIRLARTCPSKREHHCRDFVLGLGVLRARMLIRLRRIMHASEYCPDQRQRVQRGVCAPAALQWLVLATFTAHSTKVSEHVRRVAQWHRRLRGAALSRGAIHALIRPLP